VASEQADFTAKRPMLRYHGGKWKIAPWVVSYFPHHKIYAEPFCGAASVLLHKRRSWCEYLNDMDEELINLFRVLQDKDSAEALIHLLSVTPYARGEYVLAHEPTTDPVERARRLCILSYMGHSSVSTHGGASGFRYRTHQAHTDPGHHWRDYPAHLAAVVDRLRGVIVENRPALEIIPLVDSPDTLFYVDPPYPESTRLTFGAYRHEMTDDEHTTLSDCLKGMSGYVIVSGYRCDLYDSLYGDWHRVERQTIGDGGPRTECLWVSPRTVAARLAENRIVRQATLPLMRVADITERANISV
jgi:DNA adenine methylase